MKRFKFALSAAWASFRNAWRVYPLVTHAEHKAMILEGAWELVRLYKKEDSVLPERRPN